MGGAKRQTQSLFAIIAFTVLGLATGQRLSATTPEEATVSHDAKTDRFAPDSSAPVKLTLGATENFSFGAVTESSDGEESASELNRKLTNPVSDIWSIQSQFNNFELNNGHWNNN